MDDLLRAQAAAFAAADPHDGEREASWRFGALALRLGCAAPGHVNRALREQARHEEAGEPWLMLGEILVALGALTRAGVDELLRCQSESPPPAGAAETLRRDLTATRSPSPPDADATLRPDAPATRADAPAGDPAPGLDAAAPLRMLAQYQLVQVLGRGGMGVVYKAWHPGLKSYFAVKVLLAGADASDEDVKRFYREAQASARLKHPGIVSVIDVGEQDGKTWFAMEYVEGAGLNQVIADPVRHGLAPAAVAPGAAPAVGASPGVNATTALRMTQEIAEAVQAAHEGGVVHRDLKPHNVLRERSGRLKVTDFGLAKVVEAGGGATATRTGTLMGTPAYMSPEQAAGDVGRVDARSDVYQVGAILYELLTGRPPYQGATAMGVVMQVLGEDPLAPRQVNPRIDRDAETICLKAMAREPGKRYASARELAEDCTRALAGEAIRARPEAWWEKGTRWAKRRKALAIGAAVALVGVLSAAGFAISAREAEQREAQVREKVLRDLREKAGVYLHATLSLRRKGLGVRDYPDYLPNLGKVVAEAEQEGPSWPEPRYHLGRLHRARLEFLAAENEQGQALRKDPDFAPSLYERALLRAHRYRRRVQDLKAAWNRAEGERLTQAGMMEQGGLGGGKMKPMPAEDELAAADAEAGALRAEVAADLERLETVAGAGFQVPGAGDPQADREVGMLSCARGLRLAYLSGQEDRARARALLKEAIAADPNLEEAYDGLAAVERASGRPDEAVVVYTAGLAVDQGYLPFWTGRGDARWALGNDRRNRGEEPGPVYADALADYGKALELNPASAEAWMRRGGVRTNWGNFKMNRGEDPGAIYADALADFDRAVALDPGSAEARWHRGRLFHAMRRWAAAIADFEAAFKIDPSCEPNFRAQLAEARRNLHAAAPPQPAPAWLAALAAGDRAVQSGDYAAAGMAYTDALAAAQTALDALPAPDRIRLLADAAVRQALLNAHYNLACVLSLQSAGRSGPAAPPAPAPADAAGLRDQALEHLRAALDLGWNDAAHLQDDADLAPLHDDPRWAELLGSSEKPGK